MATVDVITNAEEGKYSSGLCDCTQDPGTCLATTCFPVITLGQLHAKVTKTRSCCSVVVSFFILGVFVGVFGEIAQLANTSAQCYFPDTYETDVLGKEIDVPTNQRCPIPVLNDDDGNAITDTSDLRDAQTVCMTKSGYCLTKDERDMYHLVYLICDAIAGLFGLFWLIAIIIVYTKIRSSFRSEYKIPGNRFYDCCSMFWCYPCSAAQMFRHMNILGNKQYSAFSETGELQAIVTTGGTAIVPCDGGVDVNAKL